MTVAAPPRFPTGCDHLFRTVALSPTNTTTTTNTTTSNWGSFNDSLIAAFRANGGHVPDGPFAGRQLLLLGTRGALSGETRVAPLVYTTDGDRYIVIASKGGAPTHPDWYRNLVADPNVTVEVGAETFQARATIVGSPEREDLYAKHAELHPSFHDYVKMTDRVIPVIALERV